MFRRRSIRLPQGDIVRLGPGRHNGPLRVNKTLALEGEPGAVVSAPDTAA